MRVCTSRNAWREALRDYTIIVYIIVYIIDTQMKAKLKEFLCVVDCICKVIMLGCALLKE